MSSSPTSAVSTPCILKNKGCNSRSRPTVVSVPGEFGIRRTSEAGVDSEDVRFPSNSNTVDEMSYGGPRPQGQTRKKIPLPLYSSVRKRQTGSGFMFAPSSAKTVGQHQEYDSEAPRVAELDREEKDSPLRQTTKIVDFMTSSRRPEDQHTSRAQGVHGRPIIRHQKGGMSSSDPDVAMTVKQTENVGAQTTWDAITSSKQSGNSFTSPSFRQQDRRSRAQLPAVLGLPITRKKTEGGSISVAMGARSLQGLDAEVVTDAESDSNRNRTPTGRTNSLAGFRRQSTLLGT